MEYVELGKNLLKYYKRQLGYILSRERTLDQAVVEKLKANLEGLGVDVSKFTVSDQSDC